MASKQSVFSFRFVLFLLVLTLVVSGAAKPVLATAAAWNSTGSLNQPRQYHSATLLNNGQVLVAGGLSFSAPSGERASAELYDPVTGSWGLTGMMNLARYYHTATLLNDGKVLVVGGQGVSALLASAELYDPTTGVWTLTGSLSQARQYHTATLLPDGKVLVVGGYIPGISPVSLSSAELYDPLTGLWTPVGPLNNARNGHTATLLDDGHVLVVGGYSGLNAELYDPVTGIWTPTGAMSRLAGGGHTATPLSNGKVLIVGGCCIGLSGTGFAVSELYDPTTGLWASTGALNMGRRLHIATLLSNGQVLVAGGYNNDSGTLASSELYDPATGLWTTTGSMASPGRYFHTATRLLNGNVLVVGGSGSPPPTLSSAELYEVPDTIAPETVINSHPTNPDNDSTPTFAFSGDDGVGSGIASFMCQIDNGGYSACASPFTSSALLDGVHTFEVYAVDNASNMDASPAVYTWTLDTTPAVVFNWTGFFRPVDNLPRLNIVNIQTRASTLGVPIRFSLGGYKGVDIFETGYPKSETILCVRTKSTNRVDQTINTSVSSLSYDPLTDQYTYIWIVNKAWTRTCRQLVVKLTDNTIHVANFEIR